jgi:ubiquinone/menaquinone biosynthesis C-methylase UbiE
MNTKFNSFDYTSVQQIPEVMLRVELLKKRLECLKNKKIQNVLEVGVGSGDTTLMLAKEFKSVLCIDIDQATLNNAQLRIKKNGVSNVHFACGNIAEDLLLDQKYDHVFLIGILEHLDDPVKSLKLMSKYLTSQGIIYILVNLANSLHRWLGVAMGDIKEVSELLPPLINYQFFFQPFCGTYT